MAQNETIPEDILALNFEDALSQLDEIVRKLEAGEVGLEDSISIYTRGTHLKQHCQSKLKDAQSKIEKITLSADGAPGGTAPFDAE